MFAQAGQPHFAIAPFIMLLVIGLAMLFAVTIVVVSLIKSGKGAGVVVFFIALTLGGLFLAGLLVPMIYQRRSVADMQEKHAWAEARSVREAARAPEMPPWVTPPTAPSQAPPVQFDHPAAPPMERQVAPAAAAEVSSEAEITTEDAASPSDESSASKNDTAVETQLAPSDSESASASQSKILRPDWVGEPEGAKNGVYRKTLAIGRYATQEEIYGSELPRELTESVNDYMSTFIDPQAPSLVHVSQGYLIDHGVWTDRWDEIHEGHSFGEPMHTLHVRLQFDDKARKDLTARYEQAVVTHRLGAFGLGGGLLLALLGTLYGYLKLDTVTKGYYSGRLRLAAVLTGLSAAGAAAGLVAERLVMWV